MDDGGESGEIARAERGLEEFEGELGFVSDAEDDLRGFGWGKGGSSRENGFETVPAGRGSVVEEDSDCSGDAGFGFGFEFGSGGGERAGDLRGRDRGNGKETGPAEEANRH